MNPLECLKIIRKTFLTPLKTRHSYSQCAEDLIAEQYLLGSDLQDELKFYVDVGSHHPKRGSNTYRLYKKGWRGILVDMEEDKILSAKLARPRDKVVKAAVSDKIEKVQIYSPKAFSTNATISKVNPNLDHSYKLMDTVITESLDMILAKHKCPSKFGFLSVDIEGNDYKALCGLSLDLFTPKLICIENFRAEQGIDELLKSEIHYHLRKNSYKLTGWTGPSTFYNK
jgi:FkbM family methyltransferase